MRVGEVLEVLEEEWEVGCCVAEGGAEEDSFGALPAFGGALLGGEVVVADCFEVEVFGGEDGEGEDAAGCGAGGGVEEEDEAKEEAEGEENSAEERSAAVGGGVGTGLESGSRTPSQRWILLVK